MTSRVGERGRAYEGSQLQLQVHVNRRVGDLDAAVLDAIPDPEAWAARLEWVGPFRRDLAPSCCSSQLLTARSTQVVSGRRR